jgi:Fe-S cluster biogenesis protein NfuA
MFIQTETTPNPSSLKFIPDGVKISEAKTHEFKSKKQAKGKSLLAEQLFEIDGIASIFFGSNFVTVNKSEAKEWDDLKTEILTTIMDFLVSKKPIVNEEKEEVADEEDSDIVKQIKELIEMKVRPAVAMDGGDIIYRGFEDGIVKLELKGACSGCPSSTITLKSGIENMLKHYIPEVESVEQTQEE